MPELTVSDNISRLKPYVPGKPIEEVQRELGLTHVIKLASNENPLGASPEATAAIRKHASAVSQYPEGSPPQLRRAVAELVDMPEETLVFGNGSDEVLHLLAQTFVRPGDECVQGDPSFAMYEIYATQVNGIAVKVPLRDFTHDLDRMADAVTEKTRMITIANPNNPTGTLVTQSAIDRFLDRIPPQVLVVFDEAYHEYVKHPDKPDLRPHVRDGRNIAILRTFSKVYGLAGLRIGYGILRPGLAEILNRVRSPFNVNLLAQHAATAAVADHEHVRRSVTVNAEGKAYLYAAFTHMKREFVPSQTNFVLVDVARDSMQVFAALQRKGVIVRPGAGLGLPHHIRVTTGTMEQNQKFVAALEEVLA